MAKTARYLHCRATIYDGPNDPGRGCSFMARPGKLTCGHHWMEEQGLRERSKRAAREGVEAMTEKQQLTKRLKGYGLKIPRGLTASQLEYAVCIVVGGLRTHKAPLDAMKDDYAEVWDDPSSKYRDGLKALLSANNGDPCPLCAQAPCNCVKTTGVDDDTDNDTYQHCEVCENETLHDDDGNCLCCPPVRIVSDKRANTVRDLLTEAGDD